MTERRIAVYARVSSAEQASPDHTSIQKQIDAGLREAERLAQFGDEVEVVKEYRDEGITGASRFEDRPEGFRLLTDAKRGKFDTVIFFSLDRFTRSAAKGLQDFELLEDDLGQTLIFAKENIDTAQPSGKLFRTILAAFAEFERDTIRDRNMAGRYGKAKKGAGWATGMTPYGLRVGEDGQLEEEPREAEVVRNIFTMRAANASMPKIARQLNDAGIRPRERKDAKSGEVIPSSFSAGSVNGYLKAEYYKGVPITRNLKPSASSPAEPFEFAVPEIVRPKVWDKANSVAARPVTNAGEKKYPYALSGRIYHVHQDGVGETMYGTARTTAGEKARFYRCSAARKRPGKTPTCDGMGVAYGHELTSAQAPWIESEALLWMLDMVSTPQAAEKLLRDTDEAAVGELEYERLKDRQNQLNARKGRWAEQYADGVIDKPTRDENIRQIERDLDSIEREIARYQSQENHFATVNTTITDLLDMEIEEGGHDPHKTDSPQIGSQQWWEEARLAASASLQPGPYGRSHELPIWLVKDIRDIAAKLDIKAYVTRNDADPRRPEFYIGFAPPPFAQSLDGTVAHQETYQLDTDSQITPS